ncbi:class I SAM-dependent methyltransferase [Caproicibacter sp. BJN0012]|uniref:class I SAM-dependent methyltransferase n=1 Tax=Acutalibacteraceae TaxID=3082771 RepID=UPI0026B081E5|nr:class I SAM-dependent methyltransferase [Caproicibacter sp. BJN0012]
MMVSGEKVKIDLRSVNETLLLPLWGRAEEARMKDPVLKDRVSADLIDRIDYDFTRFRSQIRRFQILTLAIRAREFDSMIRDFIQRHPRAVVVNIGAGLDTTFSRVNNGKIKWYDLDVPQVIHLRSMLIPESRETNSIPKSMFDESFFNDIAVPQDGILFLVGGVLMYFDEKQVRRFFTMIAGRFPGAEIVFDAIAPSGIRLASRMVRKCGIRRAEMKWGIRDAGDLEEWGLRLKLLERYPIFHKTRIFPSWGPVIGLTMRLNDLFRIISVNRIAVVPPGRTGK